jgi:hypothetical protein
MVVATKSRGKPKQKFPCGCGALIARAGQSMHETSNVHQAWLDSRHNEVVTEILEELDEEQENILNRARAYADPRDIAKMVRALFARREWPNEDHPGTVSDWMVEHSIPQINLLPHMTPDDARIHIQREIERFKAAGWGKTWEVT